MNKVLTITFFCVLLITLTLNSVLAGSKGGETIIMSGGGGGGDGGGQPIVVKTGGKKGRSYYIIGRRRRSIEDEMNSPFTLYRTSGSK